MATLEKVIKDLEFENEALVRQIKDEIESIDSIQKDIRLKVAENEKLDQDIEKSNKETKTLHDQFKQNKDIIESLKNATSLLQRHSDDLKNNLKLKIAETERQREENEKRIEKYTNKWLTYEREYEKHPTAREIRKYKLESANLDAEVKKLEEERKRLELLIEEHQSYNGVARKEKEEAVKSIIEISSYFVDRRNCEKKSLQLSCKDKDLAGKLTWKQRECTKLKKYLDEKRREKQNQPSWVKPQSSMQYSNQSAMQPTNNRPPLSNNANSATFVRGNQQIPPRPQVRLHPVPISPTSCGPTPNNTPTEVKFQSKMPNLKSRSLQLPRIPQLPKMPSLPKIPQLIKKPLPQPKVYEKPLPTEIPAVPKMTSSAPTVPSQTFSEAPPPPPQPQSEPQELPNITELPSGDMECSDVLGTYDAPLDQPINEFLEQEHGIVLQSTSTKVSAPPSPMPSNYEFSPGYHAQQLKLIKQSPGDGFYRTSRPMFDTAQGANPSGETAKTDNEFAKTFSNQSQFMVFPSKNEHGNESSSRAKEIPNVNYDDVTMEVSEPTHAEDGVNEADVSNSAGTNDQQLVTGTEANVANCNSLDESFTAMDTTKGKTEFAFNNSAATNDASFHFGNADFNVTAPSDTGFNFGLTNPSPNVSSTEGGGFSMFGGAEDKRSTMFNFGNTSKDSESGSFNFGAHTSNSMGDFDFGGSKTPASTEGFAFNFGDSPMENNEGRSSSSLFTFG